MTWNRLFGFAHSANALKKGINPNILTQAWDKSSGKLSSLSLVGQPVEEKKNFECKPMKRRLNINLVSIREWAVGSNKNKNKNSLEIEDFKKFGLILFL